MRSLVITQHPPEVFFKDEGGKSHGMDCSVTMAEAVSDPVVSIQVATLLLSILYQVSTLSIQHTIHGSDVGLSLSLYIYIYLSSSTCPSPFTMKMKRESRSKTSRY
jgi:hypothetical protein